MLPFGESYMCNQRGHSTSLTGKHDSCANYKVEFVTHTPYRVVINVTHQADKEQPIQDNSQDHPRELNYIYWGAKRE